MKKYLVQLSVISVCFFAIVLCIFFITYPILNKVSFKIPESKNILVIGDSHTECAINDAIFTRALNLSASATAYPYSYIIIKRVLAENPQVDTVLLSFHSISLSSDLDKRWIKNDAGLVKVKNYMCFSDMKDIILISDNNPDFYFALLQSPSWQLSENRRNLLKKDIKALDLKIGGYLNLNLDKLKADIEKKGDKIPLGCEMDTNTMQYEYLKKIEKLCINKNVKLILINCPTYKVDQYTERDKFESLRKQFIPEIDYLDFSSFPIPDSCFADIGHTNSKGAKIFSEYLQEKGLKN